jgi:hypothetical protein
MALHERGEDADHAVHAGAGIPDRRPRVGRRPVREAGDAHGAAHGLGDRLVALVVGVRSPRAEPLDAREHETRVEPAELRVAEAEPLEDAEGLVRHLAGDLPRPNSRGEIVLPDLRLSRTLVEDLLAGRVRQVFLKQFRDAADGTRACYQAVVEAPIDVTRLSFTPSTTEWDITIHPLDSHPIGQELGVESGRALMAYEAELDMVVLTGTEVGRVVATPGLRTAPDGTVPVEPGGITDLIGGAARWVWREISALERSSRKRLGWW